MRGPSRGLWEVRQLSNCLNFFLSWTIFIKMFLESYLLVIFFLPFCFVLLFGVVLFLVIALYFYYFLTADLLLFLPDLFPDNFTLWHDAFWLLLPCHLLPLSEHCRPSFLHTHLFIVPLSFCSFSWPTRFNVF